jgi:outer membrane protein assembly factor BamB
MLGLLGALLVLGSAALAGSPPVHAATADDWPTYLYGANHQSDNVNFTAFGISGAPGLKTKWRYTTGGSIESNPAVATVANATAPACAGASTPIAFFGAWDGDLYAVNATTGALCWRTFLATDVLSPPSSSCLNALGVTSSPTVATVTIAGVPTQVVYVGASDILFALAATSGHVLWQVPLAGKQVGTFSPAYIWSSPTYAPANNIVYTSTASFCDAKTATDGGVYALDASAGTLKASIQFAPNQAPGPGVWGSPTVSPSQGIVYVATGNGFTVSNGGVQQFCGSKQPLSCSVIALNWTTLAVVTQWQVPTSQALADGDFGTTPVLFPGPGGATWLGAGNKNGWYYVFDTAALAAGPQWEKKMANGGNNSVDGILAPAAYYAGTVSSGGNSCTGALFIAGGVTTLGHTSFGGSIAALCALTGLSLWQQGTSGHMLAAPTLANGLLADEQGGTVELRDWSSGALLFHLTSGGAMHGAASFANGRLYVGSANQSLYAIGP